MPWEASPFTARKRSLSIVLFVSHPVVGLLFVVAFGIYVGRRVDRAEQFEERVQSLEAQLAAGIRN
ncbi:hypothetical protein CYV19_11550 [Natronobacterium gregoryi SP2]|uniref:Uncharacterized protein n=1 Tax=Natronobacterium gregoryi (strain ATCC 43098 / DSM 3393 / CCM 3738 / CIP 104747 / IAM 13177 / JCM 8860 / NBRC 102187 / NCIMB 2189 / SP2) TaxID=797304 RepID=A0A2J4JDW7_NATGS|nr:hypothetical protein CYV19_11550 [Natronobacterium gregoryi SP2]